MQYFYYYKSITEFFDQRGKIDIVEFLLTYSLTVIIHVLQFLGVVLFLMFLSK